MRIVLVRMDKIVVVKYYKQIITIVDMNELRHKLSILKVIYK